MYPKTFWPDSLVPKTEEFGRIDKSGNITYETKEGEILSGNSPDDRLKLFEEFAGFGAWTGGTWDLKRACKKDAMTFLEQNLLKK
jgi:hypothetical protein